MATGTVRKKPPSNTTRPTRRAARVPAVKSAPIQAEPEPGESPATAAPFKRGDLLAAVARRSPLPRSDLRVAIDLVLDEIGQALDGGRDLVLPPLGRVKVKRRKAVQGAEVMALRLRRRRDGGSEPGSDDS
ncbi:MAG: HU family DNA-binding protein [Pseudomonadota bacterium]